MINRKLALTSFILGLYLQPCRVHAEALDADSDSTRQLRHVEVSAQRYTSPLRVRANGTRQWQLSSLHGLPKILGNTDPLHIAELLPGVQTTSEYDAGLHIQGCDHAHNEISLDGTPLYGVQHLLGFFSVFNAAHFQTMTFAPSSSMASSSNRLGGLLRMESMDSIPTRATGELSVGPMSSQGTLRLPLGPRTLLIASAREAYMNLFYSRWLTFDDEQMRYSFGDYNLTLLHQATPRDVLRLNFYGGHDHVDYDMGLYQADADLKWGNQLLSLDYRHTFHEDADLTQAISYVRYGNDFHLQEQEIDFSLPSHITDIGYRGLLRWRQWRLGADISAQFIQPQSPELHLENHVNYEPAAQQRVQQYSVHGEYNWQPTDRLTVRPTLKATCYVDDQRSLHWLPAPSLTMEWQSPHAGTFSFHYAWQHQPLFQTGITTIGLPVEFWLAAGKYGKPQEAQHVSLSHEIIFGRGRWSLATGLYFKYLSHQIEYGGNILDFLYTNYDLSQELLHGHGYNYGFNVTLTRRTGAITGWLSYSFGRSLRRFTDARYTGLYPSNHERPHEFNAVGSWRINNHWSLGASYVLCSGTPFTAPDYIFMVNHTLIVQQGEHNAHRLNTYQRLDVSVNYDIRRTARMEHGINLSIYNATAANNQLFYYLRYYNNTFAYRGKGFLLDWLPSINYYIKWK